MEHIPVKVIGNILSLLGDARDGIIASTTCKTWREAWLNHLHTLSFNSNDFKDKRGLLKFSISDIEMLITETILQTTRLECLSIDMDIERAMYGPQFFAAAVIAWLMHPRATLRKLCINVMAIEEINVLKMYSGREKLEELAVSHISIVGVDHLNYPALRSLSLSHFSDSALDLNLFLTNCPKLEALSLIYMSIHFSNKQATMKLTSASLKHFFVHHLKLDKFVLEVDSIESLRLRDCTLELFELVGGNKGSLRALRLEHSRVVNLNIGENTDNLEVIDVRNFPGSWAKFSHMISRCSKLRKLCLWGVNFRDQYKVSDLEVVLVSSPLLNQLSLSGHALLCASHWYCFPSLTRNSSSEQRSPYLQNVTLLELGWVGNTDQFSRLVVGVSGRCQRLKKLVIYCSKRNKQDPADLTKFIVQLMRKNINVDVKYEYESY